MLSLESVALELLEYKTEELKRSPLVRGGTERVWQLHNFLLDSIEQLSDEERERLERVGVELQPFGPARSDVRSQHAFDALMLGDDGSARAGAPLRRDDAPGTAAASNFASAALTIEAADGEGLVDDEATSLLASGSVAFEDPVVVHDVRATPAEQRSAPRPARGDDASVTQEREILKRLARRVWWDDIETFIDRVAASWRAEKDRSTARLIYATLQNLHRNRDRPSFASDVNLRGFKVQVAIPQRSDPLVSFNDLDSLAEIVRELIDLVTSIGRGSGEWGDVRVASNDALRFVRDAALAVAQDPYAGRTSMHDRPGASPSQLRLAIQELAKERLPDDQRRRQRRMLEHRLAETTAWERDQRQMYQRDVARFSDLVGSFFDRLAKYLPASVGGQASGPRLLGGVLFGAHPALRVDSVPSTAEAITVRLLGPTRFTIQGIEVGISGTGAQRVVFVGDQSATVAPRMQMPVDDRTVTLFYESEYLHVKVHGGERSLAMLVAEALAVHFVLENEHADDLLTLLKVVANSVQGEVDELVGQAIERAASVSERAPNRRSAIEGLIRGAARAAGVTVPDNAVHGLVQRFHTAMTVKPTDLASLIERVPGESAVLAFSGEPLNVEIGGYRLTVREYRAAGGSGASNLVATMPGKVLGSFGEYLIVPARSGQLIFVRGEQEVAIFYLEGRGTPDALAD